MHVRIHSPCFYLTLSFSTHENTVPKYSDKAVDNIFKSIDRNDDKKISRTELREAFVRCSALRQAIGEGPNFK